MRNISRLMRRNLFLWRSKIADVVIEEDKMAFSAEVSIMPMPEFESSRVLRFPVE